MSEKARKPKSQKGARRTSANSFAKREPMKGIYFIEPPRTPTVLIVDENLGFVWWLGEILSKAGCAVVPALSCSEALSLSKQLSLKIDLIFVNTALSGSSAMVESLNRSHQAVRIIEVPACSN